MTDPRKPTSRPQGEAENHIRATAYQHLMAATQSGSQAIGCTGASFVVLGLGLWASELAELDQAATAKMLAALATLYDPAASDIKKAHAERKRRAAVDKIFQAVDLGMTPAKGRA